jgi:hypothetical protein
MAVPEFIRDSKDTFYPTCRRLASTAVRKNIKLFVVFYHLLLKIILSFVPSRAVHFGFLAKKKIKKSLLSPFDGWVLRKTQSEIKSCQFLVQQTFPEFIDPTLHLTASQNRYLFYKRNYTSWFRFYRDFSPLSEENAVPWFIHADSCLHHMLTDKLSKLPHDQKLTISERRLLSYITYLKINGYFSAALDLCSRLENKPQLAAWGFLNKGDIYHLRYRWVSQFKTLEDLKTIYHYAEDIIDTSPQNMDFLFTQALKCYENARELQAFELPLAELCILRLFVDAGEREKAAQTRLRIEQKNLNEVHRFYSKSVIERYLITTPKEKRDHLEALQYKTNIHLRSYKNFLPCKIRNFSELVADGKAEVVNSIKEHTYPIKYRLIKDSNLNLQTVEIQQFYPSYHAHHVNQVIHLADGFITVNTNTIVRDSKHLDPKHLKLFTPSLVSYNDTQATLLLDDLKPQEEEMPVVLFSGHAENYYHWLIDALGSLKNLEEQNLLDKVLFLIPFHHLPFHTQALLDIAPNAKFSIEKTAAKDSFLWNNVIHLQQPGRFNMVNPMAAQYLAQKIGHAKKIKAGKRLYLTRRKQGGRSTTNEDLLVEYLSTNGFQTVDTGQLSYQEQKELFSDVEIIVAPAGAALANLIFCPAGTKVLILTTQNTHFETFTALTSALGMQTWVTQSPIHLYPNPYFLWSTYDFSVQLNLVKACLEEALSV